MPRAAQNMVALSTANDVRAERSILRAQVHAPTMRAGRHLLADVLDENPACIGSLRVVRELTDRQRAVLTDALRSHA